jgi:hypothetical protein
VSSDISGVVERDSMRSVAEGGMDVVQISQKSFAVSDKAEGMASLAVFKGTLAFSTPAAWG